MFQFSSNNNHHCTILFNSHTSLPPFFFFYFSITSLKLTESVVCTFSSACFIIYSVLSARLGEIFLHEYIAISRVKWHSFTESNGATLITLCAQTALSALSFSLDYSCEGILSILTGLCINGTLHNLSVLPPWKFIPLLANIILN